MKNIVKEFINDRLKGSCCHRRASPFITCSLARHYHYLSGFQCNALTTYDFVDTADPPPDAAVNHPPVYTCSFGPDEKTGHLLAMGGEDGHLALIDTSVQSSQTTISPCNAQNIHNNAVMDVSWMPGQDTEFLSAGGDKSLVLWRLAEGRFVSIMKFLGHSRSVKCVKVNPYDPDVFASGSRDSNIIVWDKRLKPKFTSDEIVPAHPSQAPVVSSPRYRRGNASGSSPQQHHHTASGNGVTSLLFSDPVTLVSAGSSDGLIKVWDLRKTHSIKANPIPVHTYVQPSISSKIGFSWITAPHNSNYVYALAMDSNIYAYHLGVSTPDPVACYTGSLNLSYYVKLAVSRCGRYLVSGSTDYKGLVWLTGLPGPPVLQLSGHHGEVTAVDWGQHGGCDKIATCSDDMKHKIYHLKRTDPDDINVNALVRGIAEPIDEEIVQRCQKMASILSKKRLESSTGSQSLPPLPKTPSTSRSSAGALAQTPSRQGTFNTVTPSRRSAALPNNPLSGSSSSVFSTPRHLAASSGTVDSPLIGTSGRKVSGLCNTPQTPSSVDRGVSLLQWLSSAKKTPSSSNTDAATPRHSDLASSNSVSATKRAGIKRKLTEVLDEGTEDDENIMGDIKKKTAVSPNKRILTENNVESEEAHSASAAKMLRYEKGKPSYLVSKLETVPEDSPLDDSVKPFDNDMFDNLRRSSSFRNTYSDSANSLSNDNRTDVSSNNSEDTNNTQESTSSEPIKKHKKVVSIFDSPTANLPNFVKDGQSPHARPVPVFPKKPVTNWLEDLAKERKLKYGEPDNSKVVGSNSKREKKTHLIKSNSKVTKKLKINAYPGSPLLCSDKKTKQTRLNFCDQKK